MLVCTSARFENCQCFIIKSGMQKGTISMQIDEQNVKMYCLTEIMFDVVIS